MAASYASTARMHAEAELLAWLDEAVEVDAAAGIARAGVADCGTAGGLISTEDSNRGSSLSSRTKHGLIHAGID